MTWRDTIGIFLICVPIGMILGWLIIMAIKDEEFRIMAYVYGTLLLLMSMIALGLYLVTT